MRMGSGEEGESGKVDVGSRMSTVNNSETIGGSNMVARPLGQGGILCRTYVFMSNYTARLLHKKANFF